MRLVHFAIALVAATMKIDVNLVIEYIQTRRLDSKISVHFRECTMTSLIRFDMSIFGYG